MTFPATVVQVFIASPSDTSSSRDAVERALSRWNASRSESDGRVILPRRYETSAVPAMGLDGQEVINKQLVEKADIVIGIFANTLGSATPRELSGTVEEIKESHDAGKKVHVYFSEADVPREFAEQSLKLEEYKKEFRGLYGTYTDDSDLVDKVRHAIDSDMPEFPGSPTIRTGRLGANPVPRHEHETYTKYDSKRRPKNAHRHAIVVENKSDVDATDFLVHFSAPEGDEDPGLFFFDEPFQTTLYGQASQTYRFEPTMASANLLDVKMTWTEDGEDQERTVTVGI